MPVNAKAGRAHVFRKMMTATGSCRSCIASNIGGGDGFGSSVALSGDTIAVGAPGEDSSTTGVSTSPPLYYDENSSQSGAAYVFRGGSAAWTETHYVKASNTGTDDKFGWSIAIDGDMLAVGAPGEWSANGDPEDNSAFQAGAAYVFERSDDQWSQVAYVKATNAEYGDLFGGGYYSSLASTESIWWRFQAVSSWSERSGRAVLQSASTAIRAMTLAEGCTREPPTCIDGAGKIGGPMPTSRHPMPSLRDQTHSSEEPSR